MLLHVVRSRKSEQKAPLPRQSATAQKQPGMASQEVWSPMAVHARASPPQLLLSSHTQPRPSQLGCVAWALHVVSGVQVHAADEELPITLDAALEELAWRDVAALLLSTLEDAVATLVEPVRAEEDDTTAALLEESREDAWEVAGWDDEEPREVAA